MRKSFLAVVCVVLTLQVGVSASDEVSEKRRQDVILGGVSQKQAAASALQAQRRSTEEARGNPQAPKTGGLLGFVKRGVKRQVKEAAVREMKKDLKEKAKSPNFLKSLLGVGVAELNKGNRKQQLMEKLGSNPSLVENTERNPSEAALSQLAGALTAAAKTPDGSQVMSQVQEAVAAAAKTSDGSLDPSQVEEVVAAAAKTSHGALDLSQVEEAVAAAQQTSDGAPDLSAVVNQVAQAAGEAPKDL